ncbi:ubiquitin carboxyl-terminal hydrolase, partial [Rhizoctonia solani 123E]
LWVGWVEAITEPTQRNLLDNKWYYFDDSYMTQLDTEVFVNTDAYLLFYQHRSDPKGIG